MTQHIYLHRRLSPFLHPLQLEANQLLLRGGEVSWLLCDPTIEDEEALSV
jgi:hypothetical protein